MPAVRAMAGGGGVTLVMKWSYAMRMGMTDKPQCGRALSLTVTPRARRQKAVTVPVDLKDGDVLRRLRPDRVQCAVLCSKKER